MILLMNVPILIGLKVLLRWFLILLDVGKLNNTFHAQLKQLAVENFKAISSKNLVDETSAKKGTMVDKEIGLMDVP